MSRETNPAGDSAALWRLAETRLKEFAIVNSALVPGPTFKSGVGVARVEMNDQVEANRRERKEHKDSLPLLLTASAIAH